MVPYVTKKCLTFSIARTIYPVTCTFTSQKTIIPNLCIFIASIMYWGTAVAQWLKCCATNQTVTGSIPAGVSGIFRWHKILPITQLPWGRLSLNRNEYQDYFLGGKGGQCIRLTTFHHPVPLARNLGALTSWNPLGLSRPVTGQIYLYLYIILEYVVLDIFYLGIFYWAILY